MAISPTFYIFISLIYYLAYEFYYKRQKEEERAADMLAHLSDAAKETLKSKKGKRIMAVVSIANALTGFIFVLLHLMYPLLAMGLFAAYTVYFFRKLTFYRIPMTPTTLTLYTFNHFPYVFILFAYVFVKGV